MHAGVQVNVGSIVVDEECEFDALTAHVGTHTSPPVHMYYSIDNGYTSHSGPMGLTQSDADLPWGDGVTDNDKSIPWGDTVTLTAYITTRLEIDEGESAWLFSDDAYISMDITCDENLALGTHSKSDGGELQP